MDSAREQAMADSLTGIKTGLATMGTKLDLLIQRIDPMLIDHENRIRAVEQRPTHEDLPGRVRDVERWQWKREGLIAIGGTGVGGAVVAVITALSGG